jgi:hypothetical protein
LCLQERLGLECRFNGEVAMAHLFIPGPTDVAPEILAAQTHRMIGHRSQACADLFARIEPRLQRVFQTERRLHHRLLRQRASGSGAAQHREAPGADVSAAPSANDGEIALASSLQADRLDVPWGRPHVR